MKITEMRKRRSEIWEQAKNFRDTHRNDSGILSAEEAKKQKEKDEKDAKAAEAAKKSLHRT